MKTCKGCGERLPLDAFFEQPLNSDGRFGKCKVCRGHDAKAYAQSDRGRRAQYRANQRYYRGRGRENVKRWCTEYRERHPEKRIAHNAVRSAKYHGLAQQSCEVCGEPKADGHHDDYGKTLDVRWLCRKHHAEHHRGA